MVRNAEDGSAMVVYQDDGDLDVWWVEDHFKPILGGKDPARKAENLMKVYQGYERDRERGG